MGNVGEIYCYAEDAREFSNAFPPSYLNARNFQMLSLPPTNNARDLTQLQLFGQGG